jgi:hypothetical protein
MMARL